MTRYTDYLKEKVICYHCQKIITRGYIPIHKKSVEHIENINKPECETGLVVFDYK
tara:strand:- start:87 stop:251 length:165 start_codon:yes stop_codon:yes gene_type:complete